MYNIAICDRDKFFVRYMKKIFLYSGYSEIQMINEVKTIIDEVKRRMNVPSIIGRNYYNMVVLKPDDIMYISVAKRGSRVVVFPESIRFDFEKAGVLSAFFELRKEGRMVKYFYFTKNGLYIAKTVQSIYLKKILSYNNTIINCGS